VLTAAGQVARSSTATRSQTVTITAAGIAEAPGSLHPSDVQVTLVAASYPRQIAAQTTARTLTAHSGTHLVAAAYPRTLEA
jgi:hypothetical protein